MRYWIFSVTPENWRIMNDSKVWAAKRESVARSVEPGDFGVFYVKGTQEFRGAFRFTGDWYPATAPIWEEEKDGRAIVYPDQIKIEPVVLGRANAVALARQLTFIRSKKSWFFYLMGSPANFRRPVSSEDFDRIIQELKKNPGLVADQPLPLGSVIVSEEQGHTAVQKMLIETGIAGGCDVWVAKNDKNKSYAGARFADLCLRSLPDLGLGENVVRLIENIDVIWLRKHVVLAAFEIEHSTSIYSGLLRLSDLVALLPNIPVQLFMVVPETRKARAAQEINRPTFNELPTPLNKTCRILTYEDVAEIHGDLMRSKVLPTWSHENIDQIGESTLEHKEGTPVRHIPKRRSHI
jgi:predicted RNA-binding protein